MTSVFARPLLPNEPRIGNELIERELTDRYLMPALAELEAFFLTVRAEVDAILQLQQPTKLGKPYPLGQCLEITLAVQKRLRQIDTPNFAGMAATGHAALSAFLRAGGSLRQIWGDLRSQFFQNAFLIGTLYVDVSNDTVVVTKPKVEILPFEKSNLTPIKDFQHFAELAKRYWKAHIFPNHLLPSIAPYAPLLMVIPDDGVRFEAPSDYMVALTAASRFYGSETVLSKGHMDEQLFEYLKKRLAKSGFNVANDLIQGREQALDHCRVFRKKRWYSSMRHRIATVKEILCANQILTTINVTRETN